MRSTQSLSDSEFESEAGWKLFWLSSTIEVKILLPIRAFTTLTFSSLFPLNAIKFKFTYSKGWRLVSVIEIFLVNVIVALFLYFGTIPFIICSPLIFFSFQCQLDAQYNLQQAFWENVFFRKLFDCLFIPCFELTLLKHLFYLSSRLIIIRFAATRRCFRTWRRWKSGSLV